MFRTYFKPPGSCRHLVDSSIATSLAEEFGEGAIEGLSGPEACSNAGVGTAFVPTLAIGIPGDPIMALMLAALIFQGIQPGPEVVTGHPERFWGLIVSFWIGNIILVILNILVIGVWVRLLQIPYPIMFPGILLFTCIGVFSTHNNVFDIWSLIAFGAIGVTTTQLRLEPVPLAGPHPGRCCADRKAVWGAYALVSWHLNSQHFQLNS